MNLGPMEIGIIVLVVLLLFGAKAVPKIGRSAGRQMREFKESVGDMPKEFKEAVEAPAEVMGAVKNPKKAVKDALNPFTVEDEQELRDALSDDEVREALARRSEGATAAAAVAETVPAASVEVADATVAPAGDQKVVEAETARPVDS
ncbi:MAG: twin-arginine translocase TatA/TatE family subunit [Gaiellales bacterium]